MNPFLLKSKHEKVEERGSGLVTVRKVTAAESQIMEEIKERPEGKMFPIAAGLPENIPPREFSSVPRLFPCP